MITTTITARMLKAQKEPHDYKHHQEQHYQYQKKKSKIIKEDTFC